MNYKHRYTLAELNSMPTIHEGHFDNIKYDDGKARVMISRMSVADGAPYDNQVTLQHYLYCTGEGGGRYDHVPKGMKGSGEWKWSTTTQYQAK